MAITFQNQWKTPKGHWRAIPHATTKNESFLRTCHLLKRMGIKNYAFPLTLYDPDLVDVDVHALEENTPENNILRTKVQVEARRNTWYFLRECLRIYEQGGNPVPFRLDRGSCAMTWCWLNGLDYTSMQPRQTGKPQPLRARILTTVGWVTMGEITTDHWVITPDGSEAKVLEVHPQGLQDIFKVNLAGGRSAESTADHMWKAYVHPEHDIYDVFELNDLMNFGFDIYLPVSDPNTPEIDRAKIESYDFVANEEAQCIVIDHPDHLYITDDYIVTHNTVCALSLTASIMYSSGLEYVVGMMAKDNDLRQENVKRVKAFGDNLPSWWLLKDKFKDKFNAEEIYYNQYRTHYQTFVAQKEKAAADKQGRGGSMPMFHWDELEYTANIGTSYPTIMSSGSTARENAKKNGKPHSNLITTTAGDPMTQPCKEAAAILEGAMPFTEQLYDVENREILHDLVAGRSPQKMILGVFSHLQLGYDNEWLRERIRRGRMTEDQVKRDFLNQRVSIAETPIIPKHVLAMINQCQRDPDWVEILSDKFAIYWYVPESVVRSAAFKEKSIVVGCDSSEMIGRDATTLVGIDPRSLDTMFTFHCTEGNINKLGVMIADLMLRYPKIVWIPENKSSGTSLIDIVALFLRKHGQNPFTRIFNWIANNRHEAEYARFDIRDLNLLDTQAKRYFGIKTDKSARDKLYGDVLLEGAERAQTRIKDQTLIRELNSLTVRNGRVDHAVGGHDDTTVAWLLALWFILHAKHHDFYGIKPGSVMSLNGANMHDKAHLIEEKQNKIRERIEELSSALKRTHDPAMRKIIEADLKFLGTMVDRSAVPIPTTADELQRDPRRFVNPNTAEQAQRPVNQDEMANTLRAVMGIN
jgi:hypothetical protein